MAERRRLMRVLAARAGITGRASIRWRWRAISPKDILATAFHLLGIDPHTTVPDAQGRPYPIAGDGELRPELLDAS
jgi:hypothetical protein